MTDADPQVIVDVGGVEEGWIGFNTWTRDGAAHVRARLEDAKGRMVITHLEFSATPDGREAGGITGTTLRQLRLDAAAEQARLGFQRMARFVDSMDSSVLTQTDEWRRAVARVARQAAREKAAGRRGYGDDFYRLVALEYIALTERGEGGRGVLQRLAVVMAKHMKEKAPRSRDNIRDWVAEARARQFLSPGARGRGGAGVGPRLLSEMSKRDDA